MIRWSSLKARFEVQLSLFACMRAKGSGWGVAPDNLAAVCRILTCFCWSHTTPISDCAFFLSRLFWPRHAFLCAVCPFLHMSMAFLWQTFYLHLIKCQMRRVVCSTKHNAADIRVCVCMCLCHKCDIYDASARSGCVSSVMCNGKTLLYVRLLIFTQLKETFACPCSNLLYCSLDLLAGLTWPASQSLIKISFQHD